MQKTVRKVVDSVADVCAAGVINGAVRFLVWRYEKHTKLADTYRGFITGIIEDFEQKNGGYEMRVAGGRNARIYTFENNWTQQ